MFDFLKRKKEVVDLGKLSRNKLTMSQPAEEYAELPASQQQASSSSGSSGESSLGFLGSMASSAESSSSTGYADSSYSSANSESTEEKKQKLKKILQSLTERQEDLSNQIYRLSQRLELLEKKMERGY